MHSSPHRLVDNNMDHAAKNDDGETDAEKRLAEAKEARKRAKAKAKSMHARIFKKKEELGPSAIKANSTRTHRSQGVVGNNETNPSNWAHEMTSRPTFGATAITPKRPKVKRTASGGSSARRRSSISSISELEAVVIFNDSKSSGSSFSQLTGSSGSFQYSFSGASPVTQGPSKFETACLEKHSLAPKMPKRGGSTRQLESGNDSCNSLNLVDIEEEDPTSPTCNTSTTTGRPWSEGCLATSQGVSMPIREDSVDNISMPIREDSLGNITDESSVWISESSVSGVSFYSSSLGSSAADSFALYKLQPECSALR